MSFPWDTGSPGAGSYKPDGPGIIQPRRSWRVNTGKYVCAIVTAKLCFLILITIQTEGEWLLEPQLILFLTGMILQRESLHTSATIRSSTAVIKGITERIFL